MNNEKIDKIGQKLDVNSSEIGHRKSHNWLKKLSFWTIHATNFVLSSLIGLNFGLTESHFPGYPYFQYFNYRTALGVIKINMVNGIITILPPKKYYNLKRMVRIGIFILNLIISFAISHVIFYSIWLKKPAPIDEGILYSVYKSSDVINIQNKKIIMKNLEQ